MPALRTGMCYFYIHELEVIAARGCCAYRDRFLDRHQERSCRRPCF